MKIWVDADACPGVVKEILFRAAERTQTYVTLIANQPLRTPPSKLINAVQVPGGFDVADDEIVRRASPGDLVITADIPLAAQVIDQQALALSPRGELFSKKNIGARLNMRDFLDTMRSSGEQTGGPAPFNNADKKRFADQLDRLLASQSI
ncbi:MAG TPA: YaiI/YqxD family protein [Gammaproteobacteria bacterium]|nr:YaiI/YqxD family protein [Gammaproteobacteria bacterium]